MDGHIAIISGTLGGFLVVFTIAKLVCKRMIRKKISPDMTNLGKRVQQIEQQLKSLAQKEKSDIDDLRGKHQTLSQQIQVQTTRPQTDAQLVARLMTLEQRVYSGGKPMIDQGLPYIQPKATGWAKNEHEQPPMVSRDSVDPEKVAFNLLNLIEPEGRRSQLARMAGLNEWLRKNHPSIIAEPIGTLNQDLWRLVVLTSDQKTGIVTPALDSPVGLQESLKWFEGGRYDGTQALVRANISVLAQAVRDEETQTWRLRLKGKIDLT